MSFDTDFLLTTTLVRIELPNKTLRICDGGFCVWGFEPNAQGATSTQTYNSEDSDYGTLYAGDQITDGQGDEAPAASITFLTNSNTSAGDLTNPAIQFSPVSIWQASVDSQTGGVIAVVPLFFGVVDVPTVRDGSQGRTIDMTLVTDTERFFMVNEGNRMSAENHKERHPGELGLDNMTGVEREVAWGTETRPRSSGVGTTGVTYSTSRGLY